MKIRILSSFLQEKAEAELNEIPNQLEESLKIFKSWLSEQQHLKYRDDDQLLVSFLRGSKFSIQRAKDKIDAFYTFRTLAPEAIRNMDPHNVVLHKYLKKGFSIPLPTPKDDPAASRAVMFRCTSYDADELSIFHMIKGVMVAFDILLNQDDNFVVAGLKIICDLNGLQLKTALQATPIIVKKLIYFYEKALPTRLKACCIINIPPFFVPILSMAKQLLSKKLSNRVHFYSTNNLEAIYKVVPKSSLPSEYGGEAGCIDNILIEWEETIALHRERLINEDNYFSDESKRPEKLNSFSDIYGVEGSFRKLQID